MPSPTPQRLRGVLAPVLTPFDATLKPDAARFLRLCRWLVAQDCGLAMFGTNSEGNSLSVDERIELLQQAVAAGVPAARMLPGTGSCSLADAVRLTRCAVDQGCAGVLALPPFYYKSVTDDGLFAFFSEVIERVGERGLRLYLYHIPPVAQVGFSHALVERLLKRYPGTVAGMKDTGGDWDYTARTIAQFGPRGLRRLRGHRDHPARHPAPRAARAASRPPRTSIPAPSCACSTRGRTRMPMRGRRRSMRCARSSRPIR
ncbi:dihydrodipicolinate synthase family protein [Variovorax sp. UC122_21]|uniref:dihydrodipicolinate synthase family protein n=1 Tax=Variovorax sp. UC122_21 TaxID=3374554 RepID=UPI0037566258